MEKLGASQFEDGKAIDWHEILSKIRVTDW